MTAATLMHADRPTSEPTLAAAAGRTLVAAGAVFGAANVVQWGVLSGAFHLHPAVLSLSWPVAVGVFLIILARLRKAGGVAGRRAAVWSRMAIFSQIGAALALLAASALTGNWTLMMWMSPIGLSMYAVAWLVAGARAGKVWMAAVGLGALAAAAGVSQLVGTPQQYLAYACGLFAFALTPGLVLAFGRKS